MRLKVNIFVLFLATGTIADPLPRYIISSGNQIPEMATVSCGKLSENGIFERETCYIHSLVTIAGETTIAYQRDGYDRINIISTDGTFKVIEHEKIVMETTATISFDECDPTMSNEWRIEIMEDSDYRNVFCLGSR